MEEHSVPVYKWRLLPNFLSTMGFLPQEASVHTLCQVLHHRWLDLFTIISSPRKFVECLYCDVSPPPILPVLSRFIESHLSYTVCQSYKLHSYIHTLVLSYVHIYTHSCVQNIYATSIYTWLH